jgi:hypothetical protein
METTGEGDAAFASPKITKQIKKTLQNSRIAVGYATDMPKPFLLVYLNSNRFPLSGHPFIDVFYTVRSKTRIAKS